MLIETKRDRTVKFAKVRFEGAGGNALVGEEVCPRGGSVLAPVILLHGGGQTRHSWRGTAEILAGRGFHATVYDQRGHGESDWVEDGDYRFEAFASDLEVAGAMLKDKTGRAPVIVGASLGGMAGLLAAGNGPAGLFSALVLVDITPNMKREGVERIIGFMGERAKSGFATLEEAAGAIAEYLPHRPKPRDLSGLAKNLRLGDDGRYRWHWDPKFLDTRREVDLHRQQVEEQMAKAARRIDIPVLLVRGRESELVGDDEVAAFLKLIPHAETADVSGARHMVAGDKNDIFCDAVTGFLEKTELS